jgi:CP family cyanate transporter-like MFS transporter
MYTAFLNISPIMSLIKDGLNLNFTETGLVLSIPLAFLAALAWFGGFIADRIGPRRAAGIGSVLLGLGNVLRAFSSDIITLALFTAAVGVGLALCFPNLPKIIRVWFPPNLLGTASGVYGTGIMLGSAAALAATLPLVFPILGTWRGVFLIWGVISLVISALWWISMKKNPSEKSPQHDEGAGKTFAVLKSRSLWIVATILVLDNMFYYVEVTGLLPFYKGTGITTENAAILQSLVALAGVPSIILIPAMSDRFRTRKPFLWVAAIISGISGFALTATPPQLVPLNPIVLGATNASIFLTCLILPIDLFPGDMAGTASGLVISVGYVGGLIGPAIAGYLADVTGGFSFVPVFLGTLSFVIVPISTLALRKPDKTSTPSAR